MTVEDARNTPACGRVPALSVIILRHVQLIRLVLMTHSRQILKKLIWHNSPASSNVFSNLVLPCSHVNGISFPFQESIIETVSKTMDNDHNGMVGLIEKQPTNNAVLMQVVASRNRPRLCPLKSTLDDSSDTDLP